MHRRLLGSARSPGTKSQPRSDGSRLAPRSKVVRKQVGLDGDLSLGSLCERTRLECCLPGHAALTSLHAKVARLAPPGADCPRFASTSLCRPLVSSSLAVTAQSRVNLRLSKAVPKKLAESHLYPDLSCYVDAKAGSYRHGRKRIS
jgi:hypothetical protein